MHRSRRGWRAAGGVMVAVAAITVLVGCRPPPHPFRESLPPDLRPPVTFIGDSTMAAMVWYDSVGSTQSQPVVRAGYTLNMQAESCRRIVAVSCRGRFGYTPTNTLTVMQQLRGSLGEAVVIMAGYDDVNLSTAVDAVMAEAEAQGVPRVLWLTYRSNVSYILPGGARARDLYGAHNAALRQALERHPTLEVLDWDAHTAGQPQWFQRDGIHLSHAGTMELAHYLKAELDARPLGRCLDAWSSGSTSAPRSSPAVSAKSTVRQTPQRPVPLVNTQPDGDSESRALGAGRWLAVPLGRTGRTIQARVEVRALDPCRNATLTVRACGASSGGATVPLRGGVDATVALTLALTQAQAVCLHTTGQTDVAVSLLWWTTPPPPPTTTTPAPTTVPATSAPGTSAPGTSAPETSLAALAG